MPAAEPTAVAPDESAQRVADLYLSLIVPIAQAAAAVPLAGAELVVRTFDRYETVGPIVDPSGYLATHRTRAANVKLAEAFLAFRRVLAELQQDGIDELARLAERAEAGA